MKVVHIGKYYAPIKGGIEKYVEDIAKNVHVSQEVVVSNICNKTYIEKIDGVKITRVARQLNIFSTPINLSLLKYIKNSKAHIYHLHLPNPMATLAYLITKPKAKLVITWHSDIIKQRFLRILFKPFQNAILKKADKIIVTSPNYLRFSVDLSGFKNKCEIIPIGINLSIKKEAYQVNKVKNNYSNPIILFIGRLVYYKGVEYLIRAVEGLDADLLIIGEGPLKNKLQSIAGNNTYFLGKVKDLSNYYQACDIFVLPSIERTEAFGIVQLEAISYKKPVISTLLNTGVEYVNNKGILVRPKNIAELRSAIIYLLNKKNNKLVAERSYKYISKNFDLKIVTKKIEKLYKSLF